MQRLTDFTEKTTHNTNQVNLYELILHFTNCDVQIDTHTSPAHSQMCILCTHAHDGQIRVKWTCTHQEAGPAGRTWVTARSCEAWNPPALVQVEPHLVFQRACRASLEDWASKRTEEVPKRRELELTIE